MVSDTNVLGWRVPLRRGALRGDVRDGFDSIRRCTCSYCRMRGAVIVMAEMGGINILQGEDALTSYRFHTGSAQHFFLRPAAQSSTLDIQRLKYSEA